MIGGSGTYPSSALGMETSSHGHGGSITEDFVSCRRRCVSNRVLARYRADTFLVEHHEGPVSGSPKVGFGIWWSRSSAVHRHFSRHGWPSP